MDKIDLMDASFMTTSPSALKFTPNNKQNFYMPNPSDHSFETLNNFNKSCSVDVLHLVMGSIGVNLNLVKKMKLFFYKNYKGVPQI